MSLIFKDPKKYLEISDKFEEEDKKVLTETTHKFKEMSHEDIGFFLKEVGDFLTEIRLQKIKSLRKASIGSGVDVSLISDMERGLRIPSLEYLQYLKNQK